MTEISPAASESHSPGALAPRHWLPPTSPHLALVTHSFIRVLIHELRCAPIYAFRHQGAHSHQVQRRFQAGELVQVQTQSQAYRPSNTVLNPNLCG